MDVCRECGKPDAIHTHWVKDDLGPSGPCKYFDTPKALIIAVIRARIEHDPNITKALFTVGAGQLTEDIWDALASMDMGIVQYEFHRGLGGGGGALG